MAITSSVRAPEIKWAQDNYSVHCKFMVGGACDCNLQVLDQRRLVFTCASSRHPDATFRAAFTLEAEVEGTNYAPRVEERYVRVILHKKKFKNEWSRLGDAKASGLTMTYDWDLDRALEAQNDQMGLNDGDDDEDENNEPTDPKPTPQKKVASSTSPTPVQQPNVAQTASATPQIEKISVDDRRPKRARVEQVASKTSSFEVWMFVLVGVLSLIAGIAIGRVSAL